MKKIYHFNNLKNSNFYEKEDRVEITEFANKQSVKIDIINGSKSQTLVLSYDELLCITRALKNKKV